MVYIFSGLLAGFMILFWVLRNYEREFLTKHLPGKKYGYFLYSVSLYFFDIWYERSGKAGKRRQWAEALYTNDSPEVQLRLRGAKQVIKLWLCIFAAVVIGLMLAIIKSDEAKEAVETLPRPEIGETISYHLDVTGIGEESTEVKVTVSGIQPEDEALLEVFNQAFEHIPEEILGENLSLEEVRYDLELISVTDYGIRVQWESMNPEWMNNRGKIVAKSIPEEGEIVILRATLSYGTYQSFYDLPVHLMPQKKDASYYYSLLLKALDEGDKEERKNEEVNLPKFVEGKEVQFFYQEKQQPWSVIVFLVAAGFLFLLADFENMKREYEARNQQLIRDYPSLVFKLSIMLGCGITLRGAWIRIINQYQEQKQNGTFRYVYEEMMIVQHRMDAGDGEAAAYLMFGRRCKEECYARLGTYLNQNIRQGVSGMQAMLETEMNHALEERRNFYLRLGEAMNTKLLLPMILMLAVVIAVLMTPALLSM